MLLQLLMTVMKLFTIATGWYLANFKAKETKNNPVGKKRRKQLSNVKCRRHHFTK